MPNGAGKHPLNAVSGLTPDERLSLLEVVMCGLRTAQMPSGMPARSAILFHDQQCHRLDTLLGAHMP
jgi:hypothetical protein